MRASTTWKNVPNGAFPSTLRRWLTRACGAAVLVGIAACDLRATACQRDADCANGYACNDGSCRAVAVTQGSSSSGSSASSSAAASSSASSASSASTASSSSGGASGGSSSSMDPDLRLSCEFDRSTACGPVSASTQAGLLRYVDPRSALLLDGVTTHAVLGPPEDIIGVGSTPFTVEGWVRLHPASRRNYERYGRVVGANAWTNNRGCSGSGGAVVAVHFYNDTNRELVFALPHGVGAGCGATTEVSFGNVALGTWYHFAATFDPATRTMKTFLDGRPVNAETWGGTAPIEWYADLNVGSEGGQDLFHGELDELRISRSIRYTDLFPAPRMPSWPDADTAVLMHFDENGEDPRNGGALHEDATGAMDRLFAGNRRYRAGLVGVDNTASDVSPVGTGFGRDWGGLFLERDSSNLFSNPGFDTGVSPGTDQWTVGAGLQVSAHAEPGGVLHGRQSLEVTTTGNVAPLALTQSFVALQGAHALSAYVYNLSENDFFVGTTVDATMLSLVAAGQVVTPVFEAVGGGWWRAWSAPIQGGTGAFGVQLEVGAHLLIDDMQLEPLPYPTTYLDGSLGTGYTWRGTPGLSASDRTSSSLAYPDPGVAGEGTILLWFRPQYSTHRSATRRFQLVRLGNLQLMHLTDGFGSNYVLFRKTLGPSLEQDIASELKVDAGEWHFVAATWSATTGMVLVVDALPVMNDTGATGPVTGGDVVVATSNDDTAGGVLGALRVYSRALMLTEIDQLYRGW